MEWSLIPNVSFVGTNGQKFKFEVYAMLQDKDKVEILAFTVSLNLGCCTSSSVISSVTDGPQTSYTYRIGDAALDIDSLSFNLYQSDSDCCIPPLALNTPKIERTDSSQNLPNDLF